VPRSILYDNTKLAWRAFWETVGDSARGPSASCSRTICLPIASAVRQRQRQGQGRGLVGYARRNFMVPIPQVTSFAELNARLLEGCRRRWSDRLRSNDETIGERLTRDREAFLSLPQAPYEACEKRAARVNSLSLVRYAATTTRCRPRMAIVRCWSAVCPRSSNRLRRRGDRHHPRSYEREDFVFNPLHYLALLERKIGALTRPHRWSAGNCPKSSRRCAACSRRAWAKSGKREFVQVLRLLEVFRPDDVLAGSQRGAGAWRDRLRCGQASGAVPDRTSPTEAEP